jgi:hypothetical protein
MLSSTLLLFIPKKTALNRSLIEQIRNFDMSIKTPMECLFSCFCAIDTRFFKCELRKGYIIFSQGRTNARSPCCSAD